MLRRLPLPARSSPRLATALLAAGLAGLLSGPVAAQPATPQARGDAALFHAQPRAFDGRSGKVVGVYVPNWEDPGLLERVPARNLTHVLYAFLRLCGPGQLPKDAAACVGKKDFELTDGALERRFDGVFARAKARAPQLQVLASVGGWGGSDPFFHLAGVPEHRAAFVEACVRFLRAHPAFDGIDIDWEHPGGNGAANGVPLGGAQDGAHYALLMQELRRALDQLGRDSGRRYLLSTAVNSGQTIVQRIDFRAAAPALDLVFMMSYDFHGGWSERVGHHSTLRSSSAQADDSLERSTRNLLEAGVPASKLVAGVAMYGRGFAGVRLARGEPPTGAAKTGAWPAPEGALSYREIAAQALGPRGQGARGFQLRLDPVTQGYALYHPGKGLWMGYDDPRAVLAKGRFAREQGLAGVFAWELSQDNGALLNAMNAGVGNQPLDEAPPARR